MGQHPTSTAQCSVQPGATLSYIMVAWSWSSCTCGGCSFSLMVATATVPWMATAHAHPPCSEAQAAHGGAVHMPEAFSPARLSYIMHAWSWSSLILTVAAATVLWMATAVAHPQRSEARAAHRSTVPIAVAMHEPLSSCNRVRPGDASNGNVRQVSPVVEHVVETHETCVSLRHILQVSARHKLLVHASCIRNAVALLLSLDNDTHGAGIIQLRAVNRVQAQAHNRARRQLNAAV
jgi:hypothetical protein